MDENLAISKLQDRGQPAVRPGSRLRTSMLRGPGFVHVTICVVQFSSDLQPCVNRLHTRRHGPSWSVMHLLNSGHILNESRNAVVFPAVCAGTNKTQVISVT